MMTVDPGYTSAMRGVQSAFQKLMAAALLSPWMDLVTKLPSKRLNETYPWLGATPALQEWTGSRIYSTAAGREVTLRNQDYAAAIEVHKNAIDDDSLGSYSAQFKDLAERAMSWASPHVQQLLANGEDAELVPCYDGLPLFSAAHVERQSGTQSNIITNGQGIATDKLAADLGIVVAMMAGWKDDRGQYMEGFSPDTVIVPNSGPIITAWDTLTGGNQAEGTPDVRSRIKRVLTTPYLTDANDWIAVCTKRAVGPVLFQERQKPTTITNMNFDTNMMAVAVEARGVVAAGDFRCVVKVKNSD